MISPLSGTHKVLKTCLSGLFLLAITGCGPGWELENFVATPADIDPNPASATPTADSSSSSISIAPGNNYMVRVRALSADGSIGTWSSALPLTPSSDSSSAEGALDDVSVVGSLQVDWPAQADAAAWEIIIERASDNKRVVHRTVETADLCDAEGFCSIKPQFNAQTSIPATVPIAGAYPVNGAAPLYVSFDIENVEDSEFLSMDWMLSGSTTDFPEKAPWTGSFDKPGSYDFTLLTVDALGQESISTISITVTEPVETETDVGTDVETDSGTGDDLISIPESPVVSETVAPVLIVSVPEDNEISDSTQEPSPKVTDPTDNTDNSPEVEVVDSTPDTTEPGIDTPSQKPDVTDTGEDSATPDSSEQIGPVISNVSVSQIGEVAATIAWDLNRVATGVIEYGVTAEMGQWSAEESSFNWDSHRQTLENLQPGTTYHYRVHSKGILGGSSVSTIAEFTTTGGEAPEETETPKVVEQVGPVISNITVTHISDRDATVVWDLDSYATGVIEFGVDEEFGQWSTMEDSFNWSSHQQMLGGLLPETTYYFRVHAENEAGESSVSETVEFTTYEADLSLAAATPKESSSVESFGSSIYKNNLPYGGLFYGNPTGGVHAANSLISEVNSRRFRAERSGDVQSVRYHNRILIQANIDYRCEIWRDSTNPSLGQWCDCKDAGLDPVSCSYTLGSSYHVGNGGLITIEIRPDDGKGYPSNTVLAKSLPFVPYELPHNSYPKIELTSSAQLTAGNIYHMVYTNSRPPIKCALTRVPLSQANACERDRGAIGLNGVFYPDSSTTTGAKGPWFGTKSAANLYQQKAGGPWGLYSKTLSWYELGYTDGVNVGDTYTALNVTKVPARRDIQGTVRARQRFTVLDASRRVDGVWLNFGHTNSANGSSLSVALKDQNGNVLANGSISASSACRTKAKGSGWDVHCRDWGYATFNRTIELLEGDSYSVEFNAANGAGFVMSTIEPLSLYQSFDDRNNWVQSRGEISTDGGKSWGEWDARMPDDRDMTVLFTIEGMPRQMP